MKETNNQPELTIKLVEKANTLAGYKWRVAYNGTQLGIFDYATIKPVIMGRPGAKEVFLAQYSPGQAVTDR